MVINSLEFIKMGKKMGLESSMAQMGEELLGSGSKINFNISEKI
jgi:hypothetical protein